MKPPVTRSKQAQRKVFATTAQNARRLLLQSTNPPTLEPASEDIWLDADGNRVPTSIVSSSQGPEHCDWLHRRGGSAIGDLRGQVDRHIQNSYRKMGVSSRATATLFAAEKGFISR